MFYIAVTGWKKVTLFYLLVCTLVQVLIQYVDLQITYEYYIRIEEYEYLKLFGLINIFAL